MKEMFLAIWRYRHFVLSSIENDLRSRFARSKLGATWMILQPLAQVAIYSLVLSRIMTAKLPGIDSPYAYSIYLLAGMAGWSLFNEIVTRSLTVFVENGNMLKKIMFPRTCLPAITLGSAFVNNVLLFLVMMLSSFCLDISRQLRCCGFRCSCSGRLLFPWGWGFCSGSSMYSAAMSRNS